MTQPALDFGVQSYCFRTIKDNTAVARKVREIDLNKIEICNVHADFDDPEGFKQVVKTYADEGVSIIAIGVQTFTGQPDVERKWFECAAAAGAKYISAHFEVDSFHEAVPAAAKLCDEFGIKLAVHCHGGFRFGGSPDEIEHLLKLGGPNIGLALDTAWCMQIGPVQGNPVQWAEQFKDRLYGVHYKDFIFERNGQWKDVVVGTGNLDLPAFVDTLVKNDFAGFAVIEYEADPDNPVPALQACVQKMRALTA